MNIFKSSETADPAPSGVDGAPNDPQELMARFRRRLPLFALVTGGILAGAAVLTFQAKPMYTASTTLLLDPRERAVLAADNVLSELPPESNVVDTEVKVLNSRDLAVRVAEKLNLAADPDFNKDAAKVKQAGLAPSEPGVADVDEVADKLQRGLAVRRAGLTYAIDVNYSHADPQKAARIANAYADEYLRWQTEGKVDATRQANSWLTGQLQQARMEAEMADQKVQAYKVANNLISAEGTSLAENEVSVLNQQIALAQAEQAEREGRLAAARAQMKRGGGGFDTAAALGSETVRALRAQRAEVSRRKADLESRYGPLHPEMQKVNQELADYDGQIRDEVRRLVSNLEAEVQVAQQRTASLSGSKGSARGTLASNAQSMAGLLELEREAEASHAIYNALLTRAKETATQAGGQTPDARVVSRAEAPAEPSSPNTRLNLALGLALALSGGFASVVAAETLDRGFRTSRDVRQRLGLATLGSIPTLGSLVSPADRGGLSVEDYLLKRPRSAFTEAFRNLKTSLLASKPGYEVKVAAVTSAMPEEGKTLTTFCLGRIMAASGLKVAMVDCDIRHRSLSRKVPGTVSRGLLEVLNGQLTSEEITYVDPMSGAHIMPMAEAAWSDRDVFSAPEMDRLVTKLRSQYDFVLLDTPAALAIADTRVLATKADVTLFLLRWSKTPELAVQNAMNLITSTGGFIPGVALTQVDMKQQTASGYGDTGYYYNEFRKYYHD